MADLTNFILAIGDDSSPRYRIWLRRGSNTLEIRSGREGSDAYVVLHEGATITHKLLAELAQALRER